MDGWLTALAMDVIKKRVMNENAENSDQNIASHHDNHVWQTNITLNFGNLETMS